MKFQPLFETEEVDLAESCVAFSVPTNTYANTSIQVGSIDGNPKDPQYKDKPGANEVSFA